MSKSYKQLAPNGAYLLFADVKVTNLLDLNVYILIISKELACSWPFALSLTPVTSY